MDTETERIVQRIIHDLGELRKHVNDISSRDTPAWGAGVVYTVSWTGTGVSPGNATLTGRYIKIGKSCTVWVQLIGGSTTNFGTGNWSISIPFTSTSVGSIISWGVGKVRKAATATYPYIVQLQPGASVINIFVPTTAGTNTEYINSLTPITWAAGDRLDFEITYEVA